MSDPEKSSFDPEPSCSNTTVLEINEQKVNTSKLIKTRDYRPAPACRKRKREEKNYVRNKIELFKMCKPFSINLERLPHPMTSKMQTKCDQVVRTKRRHRWSKGFAGKLRKKLKSEKPIEKSTKMLTENSIEKSKKSETREKFSEDNNISDSSMLSEHPWGCCRMIPFEINQSKNYAKSSMSRTRDSIVPGRSQTEVPNTQITNHAASTMFLIDRKLSEEDKRSSSKTKENETPTDIAKKHDSHSLPSLPVKEKRTSTVKEESTSKTLEDELVCRRILPYTRKTKCKPLLNSPNNAIAQALSSKHSAQSKSVQNHNLNERKQKTSESSLKRETRISETEKYSSYSITESRVVKNSYREKEKNLNKLSNNDTTFEIRERSSELESKVCEKTDETKVPEPKVSNDYDNDENLEDINFTWNASNMWKYKRKNRIRRISSSSSEEEVPRKKAKISTTVDCKSSSEIKPGPSCTKGKRKSHLGMQTLCPSTCTHTEHQGHINFLYNKPKVRPLKEGRVLLQRLEDVKNNFEIIRWRNRLIKLEMEEVDEEERYEDGKDSRYHVMYDDRTVSNEAFSRKPTYQMRDMTDFDTIDAAYQDYDKTNPCEDQLFSNSTLDMTNYYAVDESQNLRDVIRQVDLPKDEALDDLLRDDDGIPLEFSEHPKVLLIRLESLIGSFETEYSAFEIENLEEKFIDFMMNSNFSYDKQSQSFFEVYKRLYTKRARDRELEMLNRVSPFYANEDNSEVHELEETDSRDDFVDEKPLLIALDTEREDPTIVEWASDVSSNNSASEDTCALVNHDSKIATITSVPNNVKQSNESPVCGNNEINSIEFVTCDNISKKAESSKEDPLYITCKLCKVSFKNHHAFSLHKAECHVKNKLSFMCEYCSQQYKCLRTLKLHIQCVHEQEDSVPQKHKTSHKLTEKISTKTNEKTSNKANDKTSSKSNEKTSSKVNENKSVSSHQKRKLIPAQQNLSCGVCSVDFESKETLWDHILKHTERELQDAYNDATKKKNKNPGLENKLEKSEKQKKVKPVESNKSKSSSNENDESKKDKKQSPTKYTQWKDRILYKTSTNDETDKNASTSRDSIENEAEEIILSSSESEVCTESNKDYEILDINSSRGSVIKNTNSAQDDVHPSQVTMCPCHTNDTSTMVNGDMQIEMVFLCNICQVLFRRRDCLEVHYRDNKSCNLDRKSRTPKLFCSYCRIILNSLPEMRVHLEKHAQINRQGHVTFLCNICKVMFFGVGSLFYSHWFNHNKDVTFLASRYSFPKLSIVQIVNTLNKKIQNQKDEYLFVAEYVCKDCKIPFGSEADLKKHACVGLRASALVPVTFPASKPQETAQPTQIVNVRVNCLVCNKVFSNKKEYDVHERVQNHLNSTKPQYICVSSDANEKAYICTLCKTVRMSVEDLKEHWSFHRPWREKFICANCPELSSSTFEEIESHCKRCFKNLVAVCIVTLISASYQCKSCSLHFETSKELKEHRLMCSSSSFSHTTYIGTADLENDPLSSSVLPSDMHTVESSVPSSVSSAAPPNVVSSVPPTLPSSVTTSLPSNKTLIPLLPKSAPSKSKLTSANLLQKYLTLSSTPKPKSKSKHQVNQDVEIIDILSESSSRSSVDKDHGKTNLVLNSFNEPSTLEIDPFDSYVPGNLKNKHGRQDRSFSKSVVCYPPKRKDSKNKSKMTSKKDPMNIPNAQKNTISIDSEKSSLAMTAVNPEFELLLSELESLESSIDPLKESNTLRNVRKKSANTEFNHETSLLNTPSAENTTNIIEDACSSVLSETSSSSSLKRTEKETLIPLPFEVVLLQDEEADNPKAGTVSQISTAQVDINSNKSTNPENAQILIHDQVTDNNSTSDKDAQSETNTASIIEEYIEYIMMDEDETDKSAAKVQPVPANPAPIEVTSKVEKVAPSRLRVRSLAELQEIKMHHCDDCGQSFDSTKKFEEHIQLHNCVVPQPTDFLQRPPPPYRELNQDPRPQAGNSAEVDYREALTQNLMRRGVLSANRDFVPPLVPLSIQQINSSVSKQNMRPVSPNLVIPEIKKRQPLPFKGQQTYNNNTGVITPSSTSRFNTSGSHNAPRSGTIQLPERTGVNALQKRPSGAATRIQNHSHFKRSVVPSVIQHRGLPQVYVNRQPGKVSHSVGTPTGPPLNNSSGGSMTIRPVLDNSVDGSLTCDSCNFTAVSVPEFSSHLIMHLMESSTEPTNQTVNDNDQRNHNQPIDTALRHSPNTSRYQNLPIPEGAVINGKSSVVTGDWQTPARYVYACKLCDFRTESKASIRLHEKNHSTVAVMRQKNLERLQNHEMIQQTFKTQQQQQQSQSHFNPTFSQLIEHRKKNQPTTVTTNDKNGVSLYNRVSGDIFQCQLCNQFLFKSQEEFNKHLNNSHKETRKEVVVETADSSTVCFVCDYCETPQIFESEVNLRKHMNFLHNHICQICTLRCTSKELLQNHILSHKLENET